MLALKYYNSILVGIFPSSTFVRCSLLIICTIFCSVNMGVMNFKKFIQNYKFKRTTLRKYVSLAYQALFTLYTFQNFYSSLFGYISYLLFLHYETFFATLLPNLFRISPPSADVLLYSPPILFVLYSMIGALS